MTIIDLYITKDIGQIITKAVRNQFSDYRQKKLLGITNPAVKRQNEFNEYFTNHAFFARDNEQVFPLNVNKKPGGKPYLVDKPIYFNTSHSNDFYLIGISSIELGVDVQVMNKKSLVLAKRIFNDNEMKEFNKLRDTEKLKVFFRTWTIIEALSKLLGIGLAIKFKDVSIDYQESFVSINGERFPFWFKQPNDDLMMAVVGTMSFQINLNDERADN